MSIACPQYSRPASRSSRGTARGEGQQNASETNVGPTWPAGDWLEQEQEGAHASARVCREMLLAALPEHEFLEASSPACAAIDGEDGRSLRVVPGNGADNMH